MRKQLTLLAWIMMAIPSLLSGQSWLWQNEFGGSLWDIGRSIAVDPEGNIVMVGSFQDVAVFGGQVFSNVSTCPNQTDNTDLFVAKLDTNGQWLWIRQIGGCFLSVGPLEGWYLDLALDTAGNIYITGGLYGPAQFGNTTLVPGANSDAFVAKMDPNGNWLWATQSYSDGWVDSYGIAVDQTGAAVITGRYYGSASFGLNLVQSTLSGDTHSGDLFVAKVNATGFWLWAKSAGSPQQDYEAGYDVAVDMVGNVYVAGAMAGLAYFEDTIAIPGTVTDRYSALVMKLNAAGDYQWSAIGKPCSLPICNGRWAYATAIAVSPNGENVYAGGNLRGDVVYNFGPISVSGFGNFDYNAIWVAQLTGSGQWVLVDVAGSPGGNSPLPQDWLFDLKINSQGDVFVCGQFSNVPEAYFGDITIDGNEPERAFIGKITLGGYWLWVMQGQNLNGGICGIATGPRNTLYTVGYAGAPAQATVSRICDPIWFYRDSDQDGYGNSEEAVFDCYPLPMYVDNEWDCDDTNPDIHPGVEEICNEVDDNCDGFIDEGFDQDQDGYTSCSGDCDDNNELLNPGTVWFKDADHDGFTDYEILQQCEQPNGYVDPITLISIAFDCDDTNPLINPNAPDPCNGVDDNCDGTIDEGLTWYKDLDGDGYSDGQTLADCVQPVGYTLPENLEASDGDCDDTNPNTYPGAPELCNGLDDNCNELFDEIFPDNDFDGFSTCAGDCDDTNPDINPYTMWWKDDDNDGYSDGAFLQQCEQPAGFKLSNQLIASYGDCDDLDPAINPDAMETCNHLDDNCDGLTDNDISDWGQGFTWVGNVTFRYQYQIDAWPPCYKVIQGKLNISGSQITSLGPLLGLRQVTGKVEIIKTRLNDLYGLDSLLSVGGDLAIWRNGALFSLQGLNQLQAVGQRLDIMQNNQLSDCCPIQPLIASGGVGGAMRITGNATGCESPLALATACNQPAPKHSQPGLPADEPALLVNAYPNPVNDVLYLEGFSETPLELTIQIRNIQGQLLWTQEISLPEGPFTLDIPEFNHWPQGVYGIMLKNDNLPAEVLRIVKL